MGAQTQERYTFGRHETFPFRYGWLQKGVRAAKRDPNIFNAPDAAVHLGVGKNMVRAIRFWCTATKLLEEHPHPENHRLSHLKPTQWAKRLLGKWDPYFEDEGSLWLLQWLLLRPPCLATAWQFFFNHLNISECTREALVQRLLVFCQEANAKRLALTTLRRDIDCLLRMYAPRGTASDKRLAYEDTLDSPFGELGLLSGDPSRRYFRRNLGPKSSLPPLVFGFSLLDFASRTSGNSLSIAAAAYDPGSPGCVFALDEQSLQHHVDELLACRVGITQSTTAGLRQIYFPKKLLDEPSTLLVDHYRGGAR